MPNDAYIALIPLLPLAAFVVLGLFGRKSLLRLSGIIGTGAVLISTGLSLWTAYRYFAACLSDGACRLITPLKVTWLTFSPGLSIDLSVILDPISVMMIVVVSFVSLMVHVFSLGYMKGETRFGTYYAFLGLFTFSMLGLVLSGNIFEIYIFWELVGCSSFLLIGYYFDRPSAVAAAKKAFIVTRFADLGFLVGILILSFHAETLDFHTLIQRLTGPSPQLASITRASFLGISLLSWGLVLVFIGGAGKSALFPLHIWLPDAMEGPTPVSALIHAATMVVAGVYLVARLYPVYMFADPAVLRVVLYVGAFSALFAAIVACVQTDIKRVLAYSTMSQIGYMMFALGTFQAAGEENTLGYTASMFHLFTHAFFKALLFLCAGVIIHRVHSNEMKDMGGLRKLLPLTHGCFLIACLAIAGIPPFSGFFSKEEILLAAFHANKFVFAVGLFTSGLTAFYMFRLYFSVFWRRQSQDVGSHHGEAPLTMKIPLVILAAGAIFAGFVPFSRWVTYDGAPGKGQGIGGFAIAPVMLALLGMLLAGFFYQKESARPAKAAAALGGLYKFAYHKFYIDEVYSFITKKIIFNFIGRPAAWIDRNIVDGFMNLLAGVTARISARIKGFQSGRVQDYALYFFAGVAALAVLFIYIYT
ncbi:NADH-quinone oxidoreductase subunit L [Flavitalea sp. BT771]|uniref:NADH-quinone oxidoreductase subunit L n=1 Tax=Flavitalea sp. BT771 TaxID=3063329 RepID=UPI0026E32A55|nr:NADH-quinone oxidoreductase subunit L [Flavitalea sp. BT771]MDO6429768.1 NADH-quinone oxidoreductase subunit L [Flavitalea sp. BT771]MDV6218104.1 NADH-quinone oxidoreductase subunit L [Flavitalea sp. BT771]